MSIVNTRVRDILCEKDFALPSKAQRSGCAFLAVSNSRGRSFTYTVRARVKSSGQLFRADRLTAADVVFEISFFYRYTNIEKRVAGEFSRDSSRISARTYFPEKIL